MYRRYDPGTSFPSSPPDASGEYGVDSVRDHYMGGTGTGTPTPTEDFGLFWGMGQSYSDAVPSLQGRPRGHERRPSGDISVHTTHLHAPVRENAGSKLLDLTPASLPGHDPLDSYGLRHHALRDRKETRWQPRVIG
ncbi:unnamed protein product, partial [Discosporangium mesarthrocarpum]